MKLRVFLMVFCMALLSLQVNSASAAEQGVNSISAKEAAAIVQRKYGGKVLKVNKQKNSGSYNVKIVTENGQVISTSVNSKTGAIQGNH